MIVCGPWDFRWFQCVALEFQTTCKYKYDYKYIFRFRLLLWINRNNYEVECFFVVYSFIETCTRDYWRFGSNNVDYVNPCDHFFYWDHFLWDHFLSWFSVKISIEITSYEITSFYQILISGIWRTKVFPWLKLSEDSASSCTQSNVDCI